MISWFGLSSSAESHAWAQKHCFLLTKFDPADAIAQCLICPWHRQILSSWYSVIPQRDFPDAWWQLDYIQFSLVAQSCLTLGDPMNCSMPGLSVHHQLRVHSNSCPLSRWCHIAISSSVVPFSFCPQSLPASESFLMSQLFAWGGQSTGVSAFASVLPMNTQDWSPLGWTGWISLQSKGLSRVFSNTTVQKHQFFSAQLSRQSNSHIHTWPLEKP